MNQSFKNNADALMQLIFNKNIEIHVFDIVLFFQNETEFFRAEINKQLRHRESDKEYQQAKDIFSNGIDIMVTLFLLFSTA